MKTLNKQAGFSLLEVLVAFALLILTLPVAYQLYRTTIQSSQLQHEYFVASTIAHNKMKELNPKDLIEDSSENGVEHDHYRWTRTITTHVNDIEEVSLNSNINLLLKHIDVQVSWLNDKKTHDVDYQTAMLVTVR